MSDGCEVRVTLGTVWKLKVLIFFYLKQNTMIQNCKQCRRYSLIASCEIGVFYRKSLRFTTNNGNICGKEERLRGGKEQTDRLR